MVYKIVLKRFAMNICEFAENLEGETNIQILPVSALEGINVAAPSKELAWFEGPSLLEVLENVDIDQNVLRASSVSQCSMWIVLTYDFRGFAGTVASGRVSVGDEPRRCHQEKTSKVARIVTLMVIWICLCGLGGNADPWRWNQISVVVIWLKGKMAQIESTTYWQTSCGWQSNHCNRAKLTISRSLVRRLLVWGWNGSSPIRHQQLLDSRSRWWVATRMVLACVSGHWNETVLGRINTWKCWYWWLHRDRPSN